MDRLRRLLVELDSVQHRDGWVLPLNLLNDPLYFTLDCGSGDDLLCQSQNGTGPNHGLLWAVNNVKVDDVHGPVVPDRPVHDV